MSPHLCKKEGKTKKYISGCLSEGKKNKRRRNQQPRRLITFSGGETGWNGSGRGWDRRVWSVVTLNRGHLFFKYNFDF